MAPLDLHSVGSSGGRAGTSALAILLLTTLAAAGPAAGSAGEESAREAAGSGGALYCEGKVQDPKAWRDGIFEPLRTSARFKAECGGLEGTSAAPPVEISIGGIAEYCLSPLLCHGLGGVSDSQWVGASCLSVWLLCAFHPQPVEYDLYVEFEDHCHDVPCYDAGYALFSGTVAFTTDRGSGYSLHGPPTCSPWETVEYIGLSCTMVPQATPPVPAGVIFVPPPLPEPVEKVCDDQLGRPACY